MVRDASRSWQRVRVGVVKVVTAERGGRRSGGRSIVQPVLKRDLHARQQEAQAKAQLLNDKSSKQSYTARVKQSVGASVAAQR